MRSVARLALFWLCLLPAIASAHKASDSYLNLELAPATASGTATAIEGRWDINLRDLAIPLHLDRDGDGELTWGEVRGQHADIADFALAHLSLRNRGHPCHLRAENQLIEAHSDGHYTAIMLTGNCRGAISTLTVDYQLLFDSDPTHRGLISVLSGEQAHARVAKAGAGMVRIDFALDSGWRTLLSYLHEGMLHIWSGYDHLAFLLLILLPVALQDVYRWRQSLWQVFRVVTAFTIAHSLTLSLGVLGLVSLPAAPIEVAIAVTIVAAALFNLTRLRALLHISWLAFAFGLLHGFGFAGALSELGLREGQVIWPLAGFNIGVELGQLAVVALLLPCLWLLGNLRTHRQAIVSLLCLLLAAQGTLWALQRL